MTQATQYKRTRVSACTVVTTHTARLGHQGGGSGRVILPVRGQLTGALVVAAEAVDAGFDENQAELGVLVLVVALQMLADVHGLLDEAVQVLGQLRGEAVLLEETQHLVASHGLDLADSMGITQDNTDLRGGKALASKLADSLLDTVGLNAQPAGGGALVGQSAGRDTLPVGVHAAAENQRHKSGS